MTFIKLFILFGLFLIVQGYKLAPYRAVNCPPSLPFTEYVQTMFLDLDKNSDADLKTCILKSLLPNQSITLIGGYYTNINALFPKRRIVDSPNVVVSTKNITLNVLNLPSVTRVLKSHRSLVHISITDTERFKCEDGTLNTTDFLLVRKFMNQIWHRFQIKRVAVTFPVSCKTKIAIYHGKIRTDKILFDRNISLFDFPNYLNGTIRHDDRLLTKHYPLNAGIFYRFPTSFTKCENLRYYAKINLNLTQGYCGADALIMHDIVKHFNFNLHFPNNDECFDYGYASPDNITGSLGCIVRKELDISFNSRFMTMYSKEDIYFLHYVKTDALCVSIKRDDTIPLWYYPVYSAYRSKFTCLMVLLIFIIGILTWRMAIIKRKIRDKKIEPFWFYIQDALTTTLFGFSKKHAKLNILRGTCLCSSIILSTVYQSYVNYVFTTLLQPDSIKTLDDLYTSSHVLYVTPKMREFIKQLEKPENKYQRKFFKRAHTISDNHTLAFLLENPYTSLLGRKNDDAMNILGNYMDENNIPKINIINECLNTYYLSFITQTGFPFYEEMQRFMQRVNEAGLPIIYYKWTCDMLGVPHTLPDMRGQPRPFARIKLGEQRIAFSILIFGYILSLIVFFIEIVKGRYTSCQQRIIRGQ